MNLPNALSRNLLDIFGVRTPKKIALSVSGGVDSMALVSLASDWAKYRGIELKAFIVDHQLRDESSREAQAVSEYIESSFGMPTAVLRLFGIDKHSTRLEELARNGRRSLLSAACFEEEFHHIMLGHHLNDQMELFMLRLMGGSSWVGLAGMRSSSPMNMAFYQGRKPLQLVRPFLNVPKKELIQWCTEKQVKWWEDPTNQDTTLTERNLIRRWYETKDLAYCGHIEHLLDVFGKKRQEVLETAQSVLKQLELSHQYKAESLTKTAHLTISSELRTLPPAVLTEVLLRIIAPLSPKSEDVISKKRRSINELADRLITNSGKLSCNILGVMITGESNHWSFKREPLRKDEAVRMEIFRATRAWSEFTPIDNRWYFRWRLSPSDKSRNQPKAKAKAKAKNSKEQALSRFFNVSFISDPELVFKPLASTISASEMGRIKENISSQPFLFWSDPSDPFSITSDKIIGFPTLGVTRGDLEVEVLPKLCSF